MWVFCLCGWFYSSVFERLKCCYIGVVFFLPFDFSCWGDPVGWRDVKIQELSNSSSFCYSFLIRCAPGWLGVQVEGRCFRFSFLFFFSSFLFFFSIFSYPPPSSPLFFPFYFCSPSRRPQPSTLPFSPSSSSSFFVSPPCPPRSALRLFLLLPLLLLLLRIFLEVERHLFCMKRNHLNHIWARWY